MTIWQGCYADSWQGLIVPDAFCHPAKISRGLVHRLYRHLLGQGYVREGDHVLDPFAGIAGTALDALTYGLRWTGVELEPRFVALAQQNLDLWRRRFGFTGATILQGDSRYLCQVLTETDCCVGSPPFCQSDGRKGGSDLYLEQRRQSGRNPESPSSMYGASAPYGTHPGQLGALKVGTLADALCSSPPYVGSVHDGNGIDQEKFTTIRKGRRVMPGAHTQAGAEGYRQTPGNLAGLPVGEVAAVVSSPPFGESIGQQDRTFHMPHDTTGNINTGYGTSPHQLGNTTGPTFWEAASAIMAEVCAVLKPGGVAAWVVKGYISKGKLVDFPAQWRQLCEAHGLVLVEEIHASLVEEHGTQETLFGRPETVTTESKSFFRRLYEKRPGAHKINHETVLIFRKAPTP